VSDPPADLVRFDRDGLVPAVVQDVVSGDVLMLAYMNEEALQRTRATGRAHYWSRGRGTLWRKGETSGNEQIVEAILVNCERNSLLLQVRQMGAVCHDGYPSCFYRRLAPDDSWTVVRERAFDPQVVYGTAPSQDSPESTATTDVDPLAELTREQFGAYAYLRDNDLTAQSGTSRRLMSSEEKVNVRIADELRELAGVLDGSHRHGDWQDDVVLEASQVIYWVVLEALRSGVTWAQLRPDRALATAEEDLDSGAVARLLRADAGGWMNQDLASGDIAAHAHATLALVAQTCRGAGIDPLAVIESDLAELRSRPYLAPFFGGH
jgi:phosphoribosyl-AMP cyclohydrolase